ncbi:uncharacterized protein EV154DRAFT_415801 [Mucor mucedo]|uniref:uncharacterized protein n=1 Tax=Mucor mucedo TaxID=29922 RepID=UPI00221E9239|nr:uncharacterized protein EV154DRAFT_415801 [Mucor mucedo]KAI7894024.1 hypothetical protein EV154DRAFT_415801 [Mucor mucedo]
MFRVLDDSAARNLGSRTTVTHILRLAQELRQSGEAFDSETYEHIISAYSKADHDISLELADQMESQGIKPSRTFYHKALQLAAKSGNSTTQAHLLHRMEIHGYKPTSKTYHLMLACMRESLELERALDTFDLMKTQKIVPGLLTYLSIIDMAVQLRQPEIASDLLQEAEKLSTFRVKDNFLYMHVLRSASYEGQYQTTKRNWEKAVSEHGFKPDEGVCLHVLTLAGKNGDPELAADVIRLLGEEGYTFRECHFSPLIEAFASTGDIASTFKVFTAMRKLGIVPTKKAALPIARKLGADVNAIRRARDVLEELAKAEDQEVDISAFNLIIHSFAYNRQYDEAFATYARAKEFGVKPNTETLDATLDACIHCRDADLGTTIYREELSRGVKASSTTLSKMVTLMCTQKDFEDAFKYLEKMKKLKMTPMRGCYFKLVKVLSAANDPRLDLAIKDMEAFGYNVSNHMQEYMDTKEEERNQEEEQSTPLISL